LRWLDDRFQRLLRYFEESKDQLLFEKQFSSPFLPSQWIKACLPQSSRDTCLSQVIFRKDFNIDKIPFAASIHVMGDSYARVKFNNQLLGEISARPSNSYPVESQRFKLFDIKAFLKKGNNTLQVEVVNYDPSLRDRASSINVIIHFRQGLKSWMISSDENWQFRDPFQSKIRGKDIWVPVKIQERARLYLAPGFFSQRTSWASH
ncbi:MAG: hypothetical protein AAFU64_13730, partial [Bacteroidota bacterium]